MNIAEKAQIPNELRKASREELQRGVCEEQGRRGQYIVNGDNALVPGRGQYIAGADNRELHEVMELIENEPTTS